MVVGQGGGHERTVADGLQLVEIIIGTDNVSLADIVADVVLRTGYLSFLVLRHHLVEEVVDLADAGKVPRIGPTVFDVLAHQPCTGSPE